MKWCVTLLRSSIVLAVAMLTACQIDHFTSNTIVRTGMPFGTVRALFERNGAEDITLKVNLNRDYLMPFDRMHSYRLRTGTVVEVYTRTGDDEEFVMRLKVSKLKLTSYDSRNLPPLGERPILGWVIVTQFDIND